MRIKAGNNNNTSLLAPGDMDKLAFRRLTTPVWVVPHR